ncbi:YL1 nuclear protein C-terminal domain-containing protein [Chaetomidium leptoderma]|uniref:YL1 nuclear protein C-terminal domain-containing protein n=1 Tax=Chaetomidium leptoderma TaxID=669021 RepID=A0AAN6VQ65_9PEZI|nr:YL1 nuclear protein C-terminal domain-containing protein [Chaetomidium leptoderma]
MSNPEAQAAQAAHQALIEQLDIHSIHKSFRNPQWRPTQRRNKNVKAILGDVSRKEASVIATPQDHSGAVTPAPQDNDGLSTSGASTPAVPSVTGTPNLQPNLAQASRSLSKLVLEKTLSASSRPVNGASSSAPTATYTNIESAPSLAPLKHYCDVTGLPAPYMDPKTRIRYHNREVFAMIRSLPQGVGEQFLEARGAQTVLK